MLCFFLPRGAQNIWICKPVNLARSLDTVVTNDLNHIIRQTETDIPKVRALFETTASALDLAQASLAPPVVLTICACFAYTRSGLQMREQSLKPHTSKAEAVVSKRVMEICDFRKII